ncbi:hypothetical protein RJ641_025117 [Dillenia turbinata]|uniref:Uncharacterized protein n=1 Tax=Dillenia turbinata TaxID=194707 RepID=A0AAN8W116_9MAGN
MEGTIEEDEQVLSQWKRKLKSKRRKTLKEKNPKCNDKVAEEEVAPQTLKGKKPKRNAKIAGEEVDPQTERNPKKVAEQEVTPQTAQNPKRNDNVAEEEVNLQTAQNPKRDDKIAEEEVVPQRIAEGTDGGDVPEVSMLDYSIENHFKAMDLISQLCGETMDGPIEKDDFERLASKITFLREWKHFNYRPRSVHFCCETGDPQGKDAVHGVTLSQFSSATVPKFLTKSFCSKDFVMYVGGSVWGLDWCPRVHQRSDCQMKCEDAIVQWSNDNVGLIVSLLCKLEFFDVLRDMLCQLKYFIAVAAHPPESSYHKVGAPLTGRGAIQIWCLVDFNEEEEEGGTIIIKKPKGRPRKNADTKENSAQPAKRPRGRPRKIVDIKENSTQPAKRPRGRPRKKPIDESPKISENKSDFKEALALQFPEDSAAVPCIDSLSGDIQDHAAQSCGTKKKDSSWQLSTCNSAVKTSKLRRVKSKSLLENSDRDNFQLSSTENGDTDTECSAENMEEHLGCEQEPAVSNSTVAANASLGFDPPSSPIPKDVTLPRLVFCLAHNGKVAWDVKWRPLTTNDSQCKNLMGYLAVLLGNGALEVWEVPSPYIMRDIYSGHYGEGTDPRFIKLEPVFRCSELRCGGRQSIPLTLEWSSSFPHDLILAGCHDGTVAVWKFSTTGSSKGMLVPILFSICDPFRPLWEFSPSQRIIYSLDWLPDPRCIILSFDDGHLRIIGLMKAAYDAPVTGMPFTGTQFQGLYTFYCSPFAIWSVHVSRLTGLVAYCSADGTAIQYQLTERTVERDAHRNQPPHFLCGSITEEQSTLTVNTPLSYLPHKVKKALIECGDARRSMREFSNDLDEEQKVKDQTKSNQTSDDQILATCNQNEPAEAGPGYVSPGKKSKKTPKPKTNRNGREKDDQASASFDAEAERGKDKREIEILPPKIVAMHRVRWNMNKGSERWLCYGGAAGIVRCQNIPLSYVGQRKIHKMMKPLEKPA